MSLLLILLWLVSQKGRVLRLHLPIGGLFRIYSPHQGQVHKSFSILIVLLRLLAGLSPPSYIQHDQISFNPLSLSTGCFHASSCSPKSFIPIGRIGTKPQQKVTFVNGSGEGEEGRLRGFLITTTLQWFCIPEFLICCESFSSVK